MKFQSNDKSTTFADKIKVGSTTIATTLTFSGSFDIIQGSLPEDNVAACLLLRQLQSNVHEMAIEYFYESDEPQVLESIDSEPADSDYVINWEEDSRVTAPIIVPNEV